MTDLKKLLSHIAIITLVIVFPAGSFFYLYSGSKYYKENLAMLEPKAELSAFQLYSYEGDTLTNEEIMGNAAVISFFPSSCDGDCQKSMEQLQRVQEQFFKTDRVKLISVASDPGRTDMNLLQKLADSNNAKNSVWYFTMASDKSTTDRFVDNAFSGFGGQPNLSSIVLVDDSLRIRKYYPGTNTDSVNLLIRHLSMVMPKEKKKEIVYDPEKEK